MGSKSLDSEVLGALHLMSRDRYLGVRYLEFVKQNLMDGALELIEGGYARRIPNGPDDDNYCLTPKGSQYLDKVLRFASEQF
jgi:hypothetical protein